MQINNETIPSGGAVSGGFKQYMWNPRSQSSQNSNWSYSKHWCKVKKTSRLFNERNMLFTSFSDVPHMAQLLHSMHCHPWRLVDIIMLGVNCKQVGCPDLPQSLQDINSSGWLVFLFSAASPRQKSQYWLTSEAFPVRPPLVDGICGGGGTSTWCCCWWCLGVDPAPDPPRWEWSLEEGGEANWSAGAGTGGSGGGCSIISVWTWVKW